MGGRLQWFVLSLVGVLWFAVPALADGFHMRAREHYETITLKGLGQPSDNLSATFAGLSNTINIWYEKPFHYYFGLAGSPIFATLPIISAQDAALGVGRRIRLVHLGVEGKVFPTSALSNTFLRLGVYHANLESNGTLGVRTGLSGLVALGYEWNLAGIGLAPEFAYRVGQLGQGLSFSGTAPAIGLHFYGSI